jgi:ubiquinone/menaquinone biosynthesis C-methylase UbiE
MRPKQELTHEQIAVLADLYSDRAEAYDSLWSPVIQPLGERLIDRMPLARPVRVIDVGTGSGALLQAIQRAAPRRV